MTYFCEPGCEMWEWCVQGGGKGSRQEEVLHAWERSYGTGLGEACQYLFPCGTGVSLAVKRRRLAFGIPWTLALETRLG
jgi:hypothetical protein